MENMMNSAGENYHYLQTILKNKIALVKLELLEDASAVFGYIVLFFIMALLSAVTLAIAVASGILFLSTLVDSIFFASLLVGLMVLLVLGIVYYYRQTIVYRPVGKMIYKLYNRQREY